MQGGLLLQPLIHLFSVATFIISYIYYIIVATKCQPLFQKYFQEAHMVTGSTGIFGKRDSGVTVRDSG
jgi:hypothetical protein